MADLFIHIGAPKTGTTAIQRLLSKRRRQLAAAGILYPEAGTSGLGHHLIGGTIVPARTRKLGRIDADAVLAGAIAGIKAEIAASDPRQVILSSEYLWGVLPPEQARRLLEPFAEHRLHLVAYLRRQDLLAQSLYAQAVKSGAPRSFADWLHAESDGARMGLDYAAVLGSWRGAGVPIETHVRVYERGQVDADISRDFLRVTCPDYDLPPNAGAAANSSPDQVTLEVLRRINRKIKDRRVAAGVRRLVLDVAPARESSTPLAYFSGADAATLLARFAEGNAQIARDLLGRADGVLFGEQPNPVVAAHMPSPVAMLDSLIALLPAIAAAVPGDAQPSVDQQAAPDKRKAKVVDPEAGRRQARRKRMEIRKKRMESAASSA